ncbi:MAG: hypothetical protein F4Z31_07855 [Gemmatimonadetes bacterium]|nr:hypothetical protein [Gemmatimonadota bacterium]MYE94277.1 hypothetical protein [Gemmatimonadota bacterium]MYJ11713.1 hypothetical protein [Gemmatimonadota bacterium]
MRTQATGEDGGRPDLVGFDEHGAERLLIEAEFWAGLTENQTLSYLRRLASDGGAPGALLFVEPAARLQPLWNELFRLVGALLVECATGKRSVVGCQTPSEGMMRGVGRILDELQVVMPHLRPRLARSASGSEQTNCPQAGPPKDRRRALQSV